MPDVTVTCPHCGFAKELPVSKVPKSEVKVTCPRCKEYFLFACESRLPTKTVSRNNTAIPAADQDSSSPPIPPVDKIIDTEAWKVSSQFRHLFIVLTVLFLLPQLITSLFALRPNVSQTVILISVLQFIPTAAVVAFICWRIKTPLVVISAAGIRIINTPFSSGQLEIGWQEVIGIVVRENGLFKVKSLRISLLLGQKDLPLREVIINPKIAERPDALVKRLRKRFPPLTAELLSVSGRLAKYAEDEIHFGTFILSRAGIAVSRQLIPWNCVSAISTPQFILAGYGGVTLNFNGGIKPAKQAVAAKMNPAYQEFVRTLLAYAPQATIDPGVAKIIDLPPAEAKKESVAILFLVLGFFITLAAAYFTIFYAPVISLKALLTLVAAASGIIPIAITVQLFAGRFLGKTAQSNRLLSWAGAACGGPAIALVLLFSLFPSARYTLRGDLAVNRGDLESATSFFQQALTDYPDNVDASFALALVYREKKEYAKAFDCLQRVYQIDPRNWDVFGIELIPDSLMKADRYAEALSWCDRIVKDHPYWTNGIIAMNNKKNEIKRQVEGSRLKTEG